MNPQVIEQLEGHIQAEKTQVESSQQFCDFLKSQKTEDVPSELVQSCEECVKVQEAHVTRCEEALKKIVEMSELEKEDAG